MRADGISHVTPPLRDWVSLADIRRKYSRNMLVFPLYFGFFAWESMKVLVCSNTILMTCHDAVQIISCYISDFQMQIRINCVQKLLLLCFPK